MGDGDALGYRCGYIFHLARAVVSAEADPLRSHRVVTLDILPPLRFPRVSSPHRLATSDHSSVCVLDSWDTLKEISTLADGFGPAEV
jgi:hypothetical protein